MSQDVHLSEKTPLLNSNSKVDGKDIRSYDSVLDSSVVTVSTNDTNDMISVLLVGDVNDASIDNSTDSTTDNKGSVESSDKKVVGVDTDTSVANDNCDNNKTEDLKLRGELHYNYKRYNKTHGWHSRSEGTSHSVRRRRQLADMHSHHAARDRIRTAVAFHTKRAENVNNFGAEHLPHSSSSSGTKNNLWYNNNRFGDKKSTNMFATSIEAQNQKQKSESQSKRENKPVLNIRDGIIRKKFIRWGVVPLDSSNDHIYKTIMAYHNAPKCKNWKIDFKKRTLDNDDPESSDNQNTGNQNCYVIEYWTPVPSKQNKYMLLNRKTPIGEQPYILFKLIDRVYHKKEEALFDSFFKYNDYVCLVNTASNAFFICQIDDIAPGWTLGKDCINTTDTTTHGSKCQDHLDPTTEESISVRSRLNVVVNRLSEHKVREFK
ncbi:hypothetical protein YASMINEVIRUS_1439 [Yasminevirus sp. GU-2018]|uniref:Uncharacterized protein n=1 Tax=Yasminevirus sp. GU-2018 TaxID=2420051 RepID=A0A5K0UA86_9VIRU|nr:hypothetical protein YASMINEVIRUS_1439 [Yasminevirus sp. GU-2018]